MRMPRVTGVCLFTLVSLMTPLPCVHAEGEQRRELPHGPPEGDPGRIRAYELRKRAAELLSDEPDNPANAARKKLIPLLERVSSEVEIAVHARESGDMHVLLEQKKKLDEIYSEARPLIEAAKLGDWAPRKGPPEERRDSSTEVMAQRVNDGKPPEKIKAVASDDEMDRWIKSQDPK